jgi:hypothetical protein
MTFAMDGCRTVGAPDREHFRVTPALEGTRRTLSRKPDSTNGNDAKPRSSRYLAASEPATEKWAIAEFDVCGPVVPVARTIRSSPVPGDVPEGTVKLTRIVPDWFGPSVSSVGSTFDTNRRPSVTVSLNVRALPMFRTVNEVLPKIRTGT